MTGQQIDRDQEGFWWLDQIDDYVRSHAYDCTCQVGGVDAMSIDTDWLRYAAQTIRDEHRAMAERAQIAEARIKDVRDLHQELQNSRSALYPQALCSCGKDYPCPTIRALDG